MTTYRALKTALTHQLRADMDAIAKRLGYERGGEE